MARRDVLNFSFLKQAIEQRYRFRNSPTNINYKSFRGIPFEPQTNPHSIFGRIYTAFRSLIQEKHLPLNPYLNLEDKNIFEKLYLNLSKDPNLKFLNIPQAALNDATYELSDQYYLEQPKEITEAQQKDQAIPAGAPPGGIPAMPSFSAPSIATRPRMVRNIPQAETEGQKLFVANSSEAIIGEKEITPSTVRSVPQGPSEIVLTDRNDKEIGKLSANQTPKTSTSELHIDKSGNIVETRSMGATKTVSEPPPKIITADRYGNIAKEPLKRSETTKIFTENKGGIIKEHTVTGPSRFSGFKSSLRNFGSRAGVFFQRNIGKHLTGDRAMNFLGKAGNTGINALSGITNLGNRPGGFFASVGRFRGNGGGRFFGRSGAGKPGGGITKKGFSSGKKWALIFGMLFMIIFGTLITGGNGNNEIPTGQNNPTPITGSTNISSCKFTRNGLATPIKSSRLSTLFTEAEAKTGIPAAVLASLGMHESPVFTSTAKDDHEAFANTNITMATGCTHFGLTGLGLGSSTTGALGLMQVQAPKEIHDAIAEATKGMKKPIPAFESVGAYSADGVERGAKFIGKTAETLTLQDFCDIKTSIYLGAGVLISKNGGKPPTVGEEIKKSVCSYYGQCEYTGEETMYNYGEEAQKDFENCKPSGAQPGPVDASTCPVKDPHIIVNGTKLNPIPGSGGHCDAGYTKSYPFWCPPQNDPGVSNAIDVAAQDGKSLLPVYLPNIKSSDNKSTQWTLAQSNYTDNNVAGIGYGFDFTSIVDGNSYKLHLFHLDPNPDLKIGAIYSAATFISKMYNMSGPHAHFTISRNGIQLQPHISSAEGLGMCANN